jgi:hypothetical protein
MLNSSERSNSVSRSCRSALRVRAENPNSLMTMTVSSLGVVSADRPYGRCSPKTHRFQAALANTLAAFNACSRAPLATGKPG